MLVPAGAQACFVNLIFALTLTLSPAYAREPV
jgi:hypothetical protein